MIIYDTSCSNLRGNLFHPQSEGLFASRSLNRDGSTQIFHTCSCIFWNLLRQLEIVLLKYKKSFISGMIDSRNCSVRKTSDHGGFIEHSGSKESDQGTIVALRPVLQSVQQDLCGPEHPHEESTSSEQISMRVRICGGEGAGKPSAIRRAAKL